MGMLHSMLEMKNMHLFFSTWTSPPAPPCHLGVRARSANVSQTTALALLHCSRKCQMRSLALGLILLHAYLNQWEVSVKQGGKKKKTVAEGIKTKMSY